VTVTQAIELVERRHVLRVDRASLLHGTGQAARHCGSQTVGQHGLDDARCPLCGLGRQYGLEHGFILACDASVVDQPWQANRSVVSALATTRDHTAGAGSKRHRLSRSLR
jgi:hypothetical protein